MGLLEKVELKRLLPIFADAGACFGSFCKGVLSLFAFDFPAEVLGNLVPLTALIVPSFFLQAFLLQLNM